MLFAPLGKELDIASNFRQELDKINLSKQKVNISDLTC